ncbi:hypothetical protein D8Y22_03450 [Salinadaptatus halalkaliphilus]|uniref:Halobacterial output domain-containing protein n=1 Tax=Salinadaptatus halalkaliphilus TaxID=2419781 RepID=A0A4V3VLP0_9EURY|nr:hypothetical protein D8Y22_03450 [Salinadaptatus halalkaliphilus]
MSDPTESQSHTTTRPISERVIRAVASHEGRDPLDLEPPLYDAINPESLDALFKQDTVDGRLTFEWQGYRIDVTADGSVDLTKR